VTVVPVMQARGRFGSVTALDHADFDLFPNEILAVIGDNGAGKSSLVGVPQRLHCPVTGLPFE
jgi:fructose transport system ATP-binding protein